MWCDYGVSWYSENIENTELSVTVYICPGYTDEYRGVVDRAKSAQNTSSTIQT